MGAFHYIAEEEKGREILTNTHNDTRQHTPKVIKLHVCLLASKQQDDLVLSKPLIFIGTRTIR